MKLDRDCSLITAISSPICYRTLIRRPELTVSGQNLNGLQYHVDREFHERH